MTGRLHGAILGLGLGLLLPALALAWVAARDPVFVDHGPSLFLAVFLPVAALGTLLGALLALRGRLVLLLGLSSFVLAAVFSGDAARRPHHQPTVDPWLLVIALPGVSWEDVEQAPLTSARELAGRGSRAWVPPLEGLDDWITLDSGVSTMGRPWLGERPRADQVPVGRVWDVAAWHGLSVGLMDWPVTAPALPLRHGGFVVPPGLSADAWPEAAAPYSALVRAVLSSSEQGWGSALLDAIPLGLRWSTVRDTAAYAVRRRLDADDLHLVLERPLLRARLQRDVFLALLRRERPDLAAISLSGPAALRVAPPFARAWGLRQADQVVAELLAALGDQTRVVLLSDQGWMVAAGPGVPAGEDLGQIRVEDLAPTLLGLLDLPAARDQVGRALLDGPELRIATWAALARVPPEDPHREAAAAEALRGLGYWE